VINDKQHPLHRPYIKTCSKSIVQYVVQ